MKILTRPLYKLPANFKLKTYSVCLIPFLRNVEKVHFNCLVLLSIMVIFVSLAQLLHDAFLPKSQNLVQNSIETLTLASKMPGVYISTVFCNFSYGIVFKFSPFSEKFCTFAILKIDYSRAIKNFLRLNKSKSFHTSYIITIYGSGNLSRPS